MCDKINPRYAADTTAALAAAAASSKSRTKAASTTSPLTQKRRVRNETCSLHAHKIVHSYNHRPRRQMHAGCKIATGWFCCVLVRTLSRACQRLALRRANRKRDPGASRIARGVNRAWVSNNRRLPRVYRNQAALMRELKPGSYTTFTADNGIMSDFYCSLRSHVV